MKKYNMNRNILLDESKTNELLKRYSNFEHVKKIEDGYYRIIEVKEIKDNVMYYMVSNVLNGSTFTDNLVYYTEIFEIQDTSKIYYETEAAVKIDNELLVLNSFRRLFP